MPVISLALLWRQIRCVQGRKTSMISEPSVQILQDLKNKDW
jgi:hypothetical protein